jgi:hypothetical protein
MGVVEIPATAEPVKVLTDEQAAGNWKFQLTGEDVLLDHSRRDIDTVGSRVRKGDRGLLDELGGVELWALNDGSETAELDLSPARFNIEFFPRTVVGGVQAEDGSEVSPASGAFVHEFGTGVDPSSGVTESFEAPDRADFLVIHVDDADASFTVDVSFLDGVGGSTVTQRSYSGDASTDVFVRVAVASPFVSVELGGSATSADYNIYAR